MSIVLTSRFKKHSLIFGAKRIKLQKHDWDIGQLYTKNSAHLSLTHSVPMMDKNTYSALLGRCRILGTSED